MVIVITDHINDYHGAVAPLHLLPSIVPCLLSLHNAEFQGLWPMRSDAESQEVCEIYNLDPTVTDAPPSNHALSDDIFDRLCRNTFDSERSSVRNLMLRKQIL